MDEITGQFVQVITTVDAAEAADNLARLAVETRLAACVQVCGPIASTYRWEDKVEQATEWLCLFKTTAANYAALEQLIKANHPYTVPEILAVPIVEGNRDYLKWLRENAMP